MTLAVRESDAVREARAMCGTTRYIVERGQSEFFDDDDEDDDDDARGRLAAKALVMDFSMALQAAPEWQGRDPVLWTQLKRTRDRFAHFYLDSDYAILGGARVNRPPSLQQSLDES